jgi:hypothetical protein
MDAVMTRAHNHKIDNENSNNGGLFRDVANENLSKLRRMIADNFLTELRSRIVRHETAVGSQKPGSKDSSL